jgi:hypothetical protein
MSHFTAGEWADFARDVASEEEKKKMQSHLESGCKKCTGLLETWKRVHDASRREALYRPPESAVRTVKGLGMIHGPSNSRPMRSPIAELLFDSLRSPITSGVRSTTISARQLLYGIGDYRLDIRIEPQEDSDKVALLGQVLNSAEPDQPIGVISVVLKRGNKVVAQSTTNRFGEFQLECDLESSLRLQAGLPHGQVVQIPLVEPAGGREATDAEDDDSIGLKKLFRRGKESTRKKV